MPVSPAPLCHPHQAVVCVNPKGITQNKLLSKPQKKQQQISSAQLLKPRQGCFFGAILLLCSSLLENTSQCGTSTIATVLKDLPRPHHKAFSTIWDMPLCGIVSERNRQPIQSVKGSALAPLSPPSDDTLACSSELPTTKISTRYKPSGSHVRLASRDISAP